MAADARTVVIIIGIRPEAHAHVLGAHIPVRLRIVVSGRSHLAHHILIALVALMYIGLKPSALLREMVGLKSCEIAVHIGVQVCLAVQGCDHVLGREHILLHLVEHVHGVHLHAVDGLGDLLRRHIHDTRIAHMVLCIHGISAYHKRQGQHHQHDHQHGQYSI